MDESKAKELVNRHLAEVQEGIEELKSQIKPISPDRAIGRLSRLEAMNEKSVREASLRQLETRLTKLQGSLKRLELGQFGLCQECEEPIPEKRLELLPETLLCMSCLSSR